MDTLTVDSSDEESHKSKEGSNSKSDSARKKVIRGSYSPGWSALGNKKFEEERDSEFAFSDADDEERLRKCDSCPKVCQIL